MKYSVLFAAAAIAALGSGNAFAYAPASGLLSGHGYHRQVIPPLGFSVFCLNNPDQCRPTSSATASIRPSRQPQPAVMGLVQQVNLQVNHSMRPVADPGADVWTLGATVGDCEDYVLNKRAALLHKGVPADAIHIAYVKTPAGADHAVLVVMSGGRSMVLDNLTDHVLPMNRTGLTFVSMSGANPLQWSSGQEPPRHHATRLSTLGRIIIGCGPAFSGPGLSDGVGAELGAGRYGAGLDVLAGGQGSDDLFQRVDLHLVCRV
jgi:predicted transglutaminase-like cysteine proteinase